MCISSSGHMASLFRFISLIASVVTFIPNFEYKLKSLTWVIGCLYEFDFCLQLGMILLPNSNFTDKVSIFSCCDILLLN